MLDVVLLYHMIVYYNHIVSLKTSFIYSFNIINTNNNNNNNNNNIYYYLNFNDMISSDPNNTSFTNSTANIFTRITIKPSLINI